MKVLQPFLIAIFCRWEILRKPFGQKPGTEVDEFENLSFHQMVVDENEKPIGVGRKHF